MVWMEVKQGCATLKNLKKTHKLSWGIAVWGLMNSLPPLCALQTVLVWTGQYDAPIPGHLPQFFNSTTKILQNRPGDNLRRAHDTTYVGFFPLFLGLVLGSIKLLILVKEWTFVLFKERT